MLKTSTSLLPKIITKTVNEQEMAVLMRSKNIHMTLKESPF